MEFLWNSSGILEEFLGNSLGTPRNPKEFPKSFQGIPYEFLRDPLGIPNSLLRSVTYGI